MNKFITTDNGGLPIQLDDFRFIDDSVRGAFKGMLSAYGIDPADSFIISGCAVTDGGTNWNIAAGYISLDGEVLEVDAHTVTKTLVGSEQHFWQIVTSNDPAGLKTFQSTISYNTYQVRKGNVVAAVPSGGYMPMLADTIYKKMKTGLGISQTDSASVLKYQKIAIGAWNMATLVGINVTIPGSVGLSVISYKVLIVNDAGTNIYNLEGDNITASHDTGPNGRVEITAGNVNLNRTVGGFFDGTNFNDGAINRGYIYITYE